MQFAVLGPLQVRDGSRTAALPGFKLRALLATLLCSPGYTANVDFLSVAIWGGSAPRSAPENLRLYVHQLRRALGRQRIAHGPQGYSLAISADELDAERFDDLVGQARQLMVDERPTDAREALLQALALWRGPAFGDLAGLSAVSAEARRLEQERLAAVELRVDIDLDEGHHVAIIPELADLAHAHPLHERFRAQLMLALYRAGRRPEALDIYRRTRRTLADELGVEPGEELRRLQNAMLSGDPGLAGTPPRSATVPRHLPAPVAGFVGRVEALASLDSLLTGDAAPATVVVSGTAGLGKTTLAVHWAHLVADRFPDGQLYVNLNGFGPASAPVTPDVALHDLLRALGIPPERIPVSSSERMNRYRTETAGRRMLVLLDNARDADQTRPLLPGSRTSVVVVTSRHQLLGLAATDGASLLDLDVLSESESRLLLASRLGAGRLADDPSAVDAIVDQCAGLPLALAIVAARAAARPTFALGVIAAELRETAGRLDVFSGDDPASDLRSVLSWSYAALDPAAARVFRWLALHSGPDMALPAAASLTGLPRGRLRALLDALTGAHLIAEPSPSRYSFHDLLRRYGRELADLVDTEDDRVDALGRTLDHYLGSAHNAALALNPHRVPLAIEVAADSEQFADTGAAMAWFTAEHHNLLAMVDYTASAGGPAWQLAWTLGEYLDRRGHWDDWIASQQAALTAAREASDCLGQAHAHRALGRGRLRSGDLDGAAPHLREALRLFDEWGDLVSKGLTHLDLGLLADLQGDQRTALAHAEHAVRVSREGGHRPSAAIALNALGWYHGKLGDHRQTIAYCRRALALQEEIDDARGQANTWDSLGYAYHFLGDHRQAATSYERALLLLRALGDRYNEAATLARLGDTHHDAGDPDAAREEWRRALDIFTELGHPEAVAVRNKVSLPRRS